MVSILSKLKIVYDSELYRYPFHDIFLSFLAFIYVNITENTPSTSSRKRRSTNTNTINLDKVDTEYCVVIKPPPPTPAPTLPPGVWNDIPPTITNDSLEYELDLLKSKCLFWDPVNETWTSNGCYVRTSYLHKIQTNILLL